MEEIQEEMCRLCLQTSLDMENIFTSQNNYCQIVEDLIGIKIKNSIGFPSNVCRDCLVTIQLLCNFKETCTKSQNWLEEIQEKNDKIQQQILQFESIKILSVQELNEKKEFETEEKYNALNEKDISELDTRMKNSPTINTTESKSSSENDDNGDDDKNDKDYVGVNNNDNDVDNNSDEIINNHEIESIIIVKNEETIYEISSDDEKPLSEIKNELKNAANIKNIQYSRKIKQNRQIMKKRTNQKICKNIQIGENLVERSKSIKNSVSKRNYKKYEKKIPCHLCGKFYTNYSMRSHLNMHNGLRPYPCSDEKCDKAFASIVLQKRHYRTCHTDYAPYVCDFCGKKCKNKPKLTLHRSYHIEPQLPCKICGKLSRNKKALKKHTMTHTGERPFKCNTCDKAFQTRFTWRIHQRVHTKEKPYECSRCDKCFAYKCLLKAHLEKYHTEEI